VSRRQQAKAQQAAAGQPAASADPVAQLKELVAAGCFLGRKLSHVEVPSIGQRPLTRLATPGVQPAGFRRDAGRV
jgi:hypothetical protein